MKRTLPAVSGRDKIASMRLLPAILALALSGCAVSSSRSTIKDDGKAYAVTREQAKQIVESSVRAFSSPDYMNASPPDALTISGYIRIMLDTCTVNATAIPASGFDQNGKKREGFGFVVNSFGTIAWPGVPDKVFQMVKDQAGAQGEVLSVSH